MHPTWLLLLACTALGCGLAADVLGQGRPDVLWMTNGASFGGLHFTITFSPDGTLLAWPSYDHINLSRARAGGFIRAVPGEGSPAFSPDATLLAVKGTDGINLWRVRDGTLQQTIPTGSNSGSRLAYSPRGDLVALDVSPDIRVWRVSDGALVHTFRYYNTPLFPTFSPDGSVLAGTGGIMVKVWRLSNDQLLHEVDGGGGVGGVDALAFSPESSAFATGSFGYAGWFPSWGEIPVRLLLWRVSDGQLLRIFTNCATVTANLGTGINALAFSPDGEILLSGSSDETLRFWRVSDGALLQLYDEPVDGEPSKAIWAVAFSPDGRTFAYGRIGGTLVVANAPLLITESTQSNGQAILRWQGGRGVDQVQQRTNLAGGSWENVGGATTNLSATNALPGTNVFYRIRSSYR